MSDPVFDCAIIGGGLAGLSLSIQLAKDNKKVILFEKESYPFHKVCGEYVSNESIPFLAKLGVDLRQMPLPHINSLVLSSPSGTTIKRPLDVGGIGISRYELDDLLYKIALESGVVVRSQTKVQQVSFNDNLFQIKIQNEVIRAKAGIAAYGKNSNIDVQLNRDYKAKKENDLFIAVKYHIRTNYDTTSVGMHCFPGGYCGTSAIEDGKVNLSYISKASNLKKAGSITDMEKRILSVNPHLKKYFDEAEFLFKKPLTISHIYFGLKNPVHNHIIMLGDASGNIAPLSGNGMSMALKSSLLAYEVITYYLHNSISLIEMENMYEKNFRQEFSKRVLIAKNIQPFLHRPALADISFRFLHTFPFLVDMMGKGIHGKPF